MKPVRPLVLLVAPLVVLAACGDDEPSPAAVVDGTEITQQDVVDELEAIAGNADYLAALEQGGLVILGDGEGNFDSAFAAQVLSRQIQYTIVTNEVARRDLDTDGECETAARDELINGLAQFSATGDGEAIYDAFPEAYQQRLVGWNAGVLALQGDLAGQPCVSEAAIEDYFEANPAQFTEVCAHHILVETLEAADAIELELAAGADFAAIAAERSTDPGSGAQGGDLGCAAAGGYVEEFRDAVLSQPIGEVGPPVESQFGFHIIVVDSREEAALADVRDQVVSALNQEVQAGFGDWLGNALAEVDVTVDARYGAWDASTGAINRPVAGSDDTTGSTDGTTDTSAG